MGTTASLYANRVTIHLTTRQRAFIFDGMRYHQLGLSEYFRRILDRIIDAETPPPAKAERSLQA